MNPTRNERWRAIRSNGLGFWHWFFLAQPYPLPERLIEANPDNYYFRHGRELFPPEVLADYLQSVHNPDTIHAMCEDYRAGATMDFVLDEADRGKRRIACPILVLWSLRGELEQWYDVLAIWRDWADDVQGRGLDCGHYLAEELPEETARHLQHFFLLP
ncbi:MAG TPA: alpha/beta hydrolase [Ktedonobacteraceae bacterium]